MICGSSEIPKLPSQISMRNIIELQEELKKDRPDYDNFQLLKYKIEWTEVQENPFLVLKCEVAKLKRSLFLNIIHENQQTQDFINKLQRFLDQYLKEDIKNQNLMQIYDSYFISNSSSQESDRYFVVVSEDYVQNLLVNDTTNEGFFFEQIFNELSDAFGNKLNWRKENASKCVIFSKECEESIRTKINLLSPSFIFGFQSKDLKEDDLQKTIEAFYQNYMPTQSIRVPLDWQPFLDKHYSEAIEHHQIAFKVIGVKLLKYQYFEINKFGEKEINLTTLTDDNQVLNVHYQIILDKEEVDTVVNDYQKIVSARQFIGVNSDVSYSKLSQSLYLIEVIENQKFMFSNQKIYSISDNSSFLKCFHTYLDNLIRFEELCLEIYLNPKKLEVDTELEKCIYYPNPLHFKELNKNLTNKKLIIKCLKRLYKLDMVQEVSTLSGVVEYLIGIIEEKECQVHQELIIPKNKYILLQEIILQFQSHYQKLNEKNKGVILKKNSKKEAQLIYKPYYSKDKDKELLLQYSDITIMITDEEGETNEKLVMTEIMKELVQNKDLKKLQIVGIESDGLYLEELNQLKNLTSLSIYFDQTTNMKYDISTYQYLPQLNSFAFQRIFYKNEHSLNKVAADSNTILQQALQYIFIKSSLGQLKSLSVHIDFQLISQNFEFESVLINLGIIQSQNLQEVTEQQQQSQKLFNVSQTKKKSKSSQGTGLFSGLLLSNTDNIVFGGKCNNTLFGKQDNEKQLESQTQNTNKEPSKGSTGLFSNLFAAVQQPINNGNLFDFLTTNTQKDQNEIQQVNTKFDANSNFQDNKLLKVDQYLNKLSESIDASKKRIFKQNIVQIVKTHPIDYDVIEYSEDVLILEFEHKKVKKYGKLHLEFSEVDGEIDYTKVECKSIEKLNCQFEQHKLFQFFSSLFIEKWIQLEMQSCFQEYLIGDGYKPVCSHCDYILLQQELYKNQSNLNSLFLTLLMCNHSILNKTFSLGFNPITHSNLFHLELQIQSLKEPRQKIKYLIEELKQLQNLRLLRVRLFGAIDNPLEIKWLFKKIKSLIVFKQEHYS